MNQYAVLRTYILAGAFVIFGAVLALQFGAVNSGSLDLVVQLRLPRVVLAAAVGAGLALAGAVLQAVFTNPLCEPYTLGISSGSAFGAVVGGTLGLGWNWSGLAGPGFAGALVFSGVLYLFSRRSTNGLSLLLAGVMLGFLGSSLVALWMALADPKGLHGAIYWLLGDLSRARIEGAVLTLSAVTGLGVTLWIRWRELDGMLVGEEGALTLGVPVRRARTRLVILSSLLIGFCVSAAGMIGFVGLVVPHVTRRFVGSLHSRMLPACALIGAGTLIFADLIARVAARPYELPVGVVTALFGAPVFLWLILGSRRAS